MKSKNKKITNIKTYFNKNININKTVVSNKVFFGKKRFKYVIGYKDGKRLDLQILPKRIAYKREFDEIKYISLLIKDDELLERYNEIWGKISIK